MAWKHKGRSEWVWVVLDAHCIIKFPYGETELLLLGKSTFVIEIWPGYSMQCSGFTKGGVNGWSSVQASLLGMGLLETRWPSQFHNGHHFFIGSDAASKS